MVFYIRLFKPNDASAILLSVFTTPDKAFRAMSISADLAGCLEAVCWGGCSVWSIDGATLGASCGIAGETGDCGPADAGDTWSNIEESIPLLCMAAFKAPAPPILLPNDPVS